jgi:CDP-diglyceride synthetase
MLKQRILTAVLLAPIVLIIILYGNDLIFSLFTSLLILMIGYEWCQIVKQSPISSAVISFGLAVAVFFLNDVTFIVIDAQRILLAASALWLLCLVWLFMPQSGHDKYSIKYALGAGVLLLFGASLNALHSIPEVGKNLTLILFVLVWVADIGAYLSGKNFGKHKLAKKVSPGKTIEGLMGGLILTAVYAYFISDWLNQDWKGFVFAFPIIAGISVIGDLFASLLKRQAKLKDSGFLLPGHGGFLDRFDSLIASAPFYFVFMTYFYVS